MVDPLTGEMVSNLSSSDIRVLLATEEVHYDFFSLTVMQVIQISRQILPTHATVADAKSFPAAVSVSETTSLVDAIEKLAATSLFNGFRFNL